MIDSNKKPCVRSLLRMTFCCCSIHWYLIYRTTIHPFMNDILLLKN